MKKLIVCILFFVSLSYAGSIDDSIKAANQGDASAQFSLGSMYEYGLGVRVDYKEAAKWYRKAAEQGDTWAQVSLGDMYVNGKGVRKDLNKAKELFQKACNHGEKSGCEKYKALNAKNAVDYYSLGEKYDDAAKVHNMVYDDYSDLKLAKKAFAKACLDNYKDSCERKEAIEKSMQCLGDANVKKLKNRIKKLKEEGIGDLTISIKLVKEDYLYWAQMRYGKYGYEIQKKHKKSGIPEVYNKCMACHGKKGNIKAFGKSKKINTLSKEDFVKAIRGYQNGTYGGSLKSIMIGQVNGLSSEDIEAISKYLKLKSTKHSMSKKLVRQEKLKVSKSSGGQITAHKKSKYLEQIQAAIKADNKLEKKLKESDEFLNKFKKVIMNLPDAKFTKYNNEDYFNYGFADGSLLTKFLYIRSLISYKDIQTLVNMPIFVTGPHSNTGLNLKSKYTFGHYNKKFLNYLNQKLVDLGKDKDFIKKSSGLMNKYGIFRLIKNYLNIYDYIDQHENEFKLYKNKYVRMLKNKSWGSDWAHSYRANIPHNLDSEEYWNWAETAYYFWIRREIDGTKEQWHEVFLSLKKIYNI